jgi:hypothetical protein
MRDGKGYWIYMKAAADTYTLTVNGQVNPTGSTMPPTYSVVAGWNLIGFKSTYARTAGDYLNSVNWVRIWSFANGAYSPITSSGMMQPGLGYWVAIVGTGTIYP